MLGGCKVSFDMRNAADAVNESKQIFIGIYNATLCHRRYWHPRGARGDISPSDADFILSLCIFVGVVICVGILCIPKFIHIASGAPISMSKVNGSTTVQTTSGTTTTSADNPASP